MRGNRWVLAGGFIAGLAGVAAALLLHVSSQHASETPTTPLQRQAAARATAPPVIALTNRLPPKPTATPRARAPRSPFIWPVDGAITQGMWEKHALGIDLAAEVGDPVRAVRDGRIIFAGGDPCCGYGLFVVIEHNEGWSSVYGHLSKVAFEPGHAVIQGQVFARAGATGTATGPHLHFELRWFGQPVDPVAFLPPGRTVPPPDDDALVGASPTDARPTRSSAGLGGDGETPAPSATRTPTRSPTPAGTPEPSSSPTPVEEEPTPTPQPTLTPEATPTPEPTATPAG